MAQLIATLNNKIVETYEPTLIRFFFISMLYLISGFT